MDFHLKRHQANPCRTIKGVDGQVIGQDRLHLLRIKLPMQEGQVQPPHMHDFEPHVVWGFSWMIQRIAHLTCVAALTLSSEWNRRDVGHP